MEIIKLFLLNFSSLFYFFYSKFYSIIQNNNILNVYIFETLLIYIINISRIMNILHNDLHYKNIFVHVLCKEIFKVSMYNNSLEHTTGVTVLAVLL